MSLNGQPSRKTTRNSGIELLRILAMVFIVFHHCMIHPQWGNWEGHTVNFLIKEFLMSFGKIGVAIFFIITGYFLHNRKNYNWKKVFIFLRPIWFYALLFLSIGFLLNLEGAKLTWPLNYKIMMSIMPTISNAYWFMTSYIAIFLLSPYLKKMFDSLDDKDLLKFTVLTSFFAIFGQTLTWFVSSIRMIPILTACLPIMYVLIGYTLKRYEQKLRISWALVGFLISSIALAMAPIVTLLAQRFGYQTSIDLFWSMSSFPCLIFSSSVFVLFSKFKFHSKIVNYIAGLMLGVYLIHENSWMIPWFWRGDGLVDVKNWSTLSPINFTTHVFTWVLVVLIGTACIEAVRKTAVKILGKICSVSA